MSQQILAAVSGDTAGLSSRTCRPQAVAQLGLGIQPLIQARVVPAQFVLHFPPAASRGEVDPVTLQIRDDLAVKRPVVVGENPPVTVAHLDLDGAAGELLPHVVDPGQGAAADDLALARCGDWLRFWCGGAGSQGQQEWDQQATHERDYPNNLTSEGVVLQRRPQLRPTKGGRILKIRLRVTASPTRWEVTCANGTMRIGDYALGHTTTAVVDGLTGTATQGSGIPPHLTARADIDMCRSAWKTGPS